MRKKKIKYYDTGRRCYSEPTTATSVLMFILSMISITAILTAIISITAEHNVSVLVVCAAWFSFIFMIIIKNISKSNMVDIIQGMFYTPQLGHWAGISSFLWKKKQLKKDRFIFRISQDLIYYDEKSHDKYMKQKFKPIVQKLDNVGITPLICFIDSNTHRDAGIVVTAKDAALIMLTFDEFIHPNATIRITPYIRDKGISTNEILYKIEEYIALEK